MLIATRSVDRQTCIGIVSRMAGTNAAIPDGGLRDIWLASQPDAEIFLEDIALLAGEHAAGEVALRSSRAGGLLSRNRRGVWTMQFAAAPEEMLLQAG